MYKAGLSSTDIAITMTGVASREGKHGEFSADTIKSITQKWQREIDIVKGMSSDLTVAEKTIAKLNEYVSSYLCLPSHPRPSNSQLFLFCSVTVSPMSVSQ